MKAKTELDARIKRQEELAKLTIEESAKIYHAKCHAVQSGIATLIGCGDDLATPKHLRVGVDTTKAEFAALAILLVRKGVITEREYFGAIAEGAEAETKRLEGELTKRLGRPVVLE